MLTVAPRPATSPISGVKYRQSFLLVVLQTLRAKLAVVLRQRDWTRILQLGRYRMSGALVFYCSKCLSAQSAASCAIPTLL